MPAESWTATTCWRFMRPPARRRPRAYGQRTYLLECKTFRMTGHSGARRRPLRPPKTSWRSGESSTHRPFRSRMLAEGWAPRPTSTSFTPPFIARSMKCGMGRREPLSRPRNPARRRVREFVAMSTTYLEAIPRRAVGRDGARRQRVPDRGGHRPIRRRFQSDRGLLRTLRGAPRGGYAHLGSGHRGAAIGAALMGLRPRGRNAVPPISFPAVSTRS